MFAVQVFWKHCEKRRNCSWRAISPFPTVFSAALENSPPFSSNLKTSSAYSFSLEESKICRLRKGYGRSQNAVLGNGLISIFCQTTVWMNYGVEWPLWHPENSKTAKSIDPGQPAWADTFRKCIKSHLSKSKAQLILSISAEIINPHFKLEIFVWGSNWHAMSPNNNCSSR